MANKIEKVLFEMITENTGIAMCDSGGDDGRMWQRNRKAYPTLQKLRDSEPVTFDRHQYGSGKWELLHTVNIFHYLRDVLELDPICAGYDKALLRANKLKEPWIDYSIEEKCSVYGVTASTVAYLKEIEAEKGEGNTFNTYNDGNSPLSQILQGTLLTIRGGAYLLLQIHGGADARGGYTDARLFKIKRNDYGPFLPPEDVMGTVGKLEVSTQYDGHSLKGENGEDPVIGPRTRIRLYPMWDGSHG